MNSEAYVHLGQWTNWADGRYRGPRITLTESGGAYLIAFLALFVRLAGQHSWGILCYIIFRRRQRESGESVNKHRDPMQSILRNMNVDSTAAWQFMRLQWRLRTCDRSMFKRSILYALFAMIHAALFLIAGVFVSTVTATGKNQVLLRGHACGVWQAPVAFGLYSSGSEADYIENNLWISWTYETAIMAADFSRQCYNTSAADSALANCNAYAPSLPTWSLEERVACPFDVKMCRGGQAIRLDSGLLDSLEHFGINAHPGDRVKYRRVLECSPITTEGYVSDILNISQVSVSETAQSLAGMAQPNTLFQEFNYGPNTSWNLSSTYLWNNYSVFTTSTMNYGNMQPSSAYLIDQEMYAPEDPNASTFSAIEELHRTDADTVLFFMLSSMIYLDPVDDPWFQATIPMPYAADIWTSTSDSNATITVYSPGYNASVMGCTQQFQYCNHDGSKCSILTGEGHGGTLVKSIDAFADGLGLNIKQQSTLSRLVQASWNSDLYSVVSPPNALLVQRQVSGPVSPALPKNQWILEMQHLLTSGLTNMQMQIASYATGPPDKSSHQYVTKPMPEEEWMCSSQIVQRSGYATFSLLGIAIVIVLGGLIVVVDLTLHSITTRLGKRPKREIPDEWDEYHHLSACSVYKKVESKVPIVTSSDLDLMKTRRAVIAVNDWTPQKGFSNDIHEPGATNWTSTYENNFSRGLDLNTTSKRLSNRDRVMQMFQKRSDEDSQLMVSQDRT